MASRFLLALLLLLSSWGAAAQEVPSASDATQALTAATTEYRAIDAAFAADPDARQRRDLVSRARALSETAGRSVATLTDQMVLIDARITQLGVPNPAITEAPDIRAQRSQLAISRSALDSAIKRGNLLRVEADQLAQEIEVSAADAFNEQITARAPSPLTPEFWHRFARGLPRDLRRVGIFLGKEGAMVSRVTYASAWPALVGLVVALVLLFPIRIALGRLGRTFMIERAPSSRLRRSGFALWIALLGTLTPGLAAMSFVGGLQASNLIASGWAHVADAFIRIVFVAAALTALGSALLQPKLSSWRLPVISDAAASTFRRWTRVGSAILLLGATLAVFVASATGGRGPLAIVSDGISVLLNIGLAAGVLRSIAVFRRDAQTEVDEQPEGRRRVLGGGGLGIVALLAWVAIGSASLSMATGYFALALSIAQMLLWWPLVAAALYLLLVATDDLCMGLIARDSSTGQALSNGFGIRGSLIDQVGVFLSAILRLILVALAFTLAMGPFGSNVTSLFDIASKAAQGLTIGEITVSPGAILRAFAVLAAGLFLVRLVQRWLVDRYLPATELDAGARNSIAMVARYAGFLLVVLWALASLGIGIERIALLLSALSVGIGFGLQAITQNFVSGLILLAERPVKIGDWVRIGADEGDIKRISVRATEIQIADKSTLIVPNSELITKAIVNKTLSDPVGRIQLQFSVPLGADVAQARDMLLAIYAETSAVLDEPAPSVFIDSITDGRVAFNSFAYVRGPRDVYPARSAILFRLLTDLPAAGIELGSTPQQMQILGGQAEALAPAAQPSNNPVGTT